MAAMTVRWSIPGGLGLYCRGEDYWDFVWCYKRAHRRHWRDMKARHALDKLVHVTSTPCDPCELWVDRTEPPPDIPWFCAYHGAVEVPSHPWMAITCFECWHTFASKREVERVLADLLGEWRPFEKIYSCPMCSHDW